MSDAKLPTCALCNRELGRQFGSHYNCRENWRIGLEYLASNLAIGAALCRAYWLGQDVILEHETWHPGCQREAP